MLRHVTPVRALSVTLAIFTGAAVVDPTAALNVIAAFQPHQRISDVPFGEDPRQRLDVYLPAAPVADAAVAIFFYGGRWNAGAKEMYRFIGAALAARGAIVVIPDYRLYPRARFPAFLEDAAQAARWTRDNARRYGGDLSRLFVIGHSAGGHIATMLAFDKRWLAAVGLAPARDFAGVVGLAGAYDFAIDSDLLRGVFGAPANAAATQPLRYVTRDAPPLLLLTGDADQTVKPRNTRALAQAVSDAGGEARAIYYPGVEHREIIGAFSPLLRFLAPVADDVMGFVSTRRAAPDNKEERRSDGRGEDAQ